MEKFVVPLTDADATDADRFGPKAANLAALGVAGLPIANGFALDADAYRLQLKALGLEETAHKVFSTCLLYTSPSPRDLSTSRMPASA